MTPATKKLGFAIRNRLLLGWTRWFLLIAGALAVSYVALTLLHARFYQKVANKALEQQMQVEDRRQTSLTGAVAKEGDVLGRI